MGRVIVYRATDTLNRLDLEANTLDEATLKTGHGIYTVFRIFPDRRVLRLDKHLERMRRSAELAGQPYQITDEWLRAMAHQAVIDAEKSGIAESRIRLTVPFDQPEAAIIAIEPFSPPPDDLYQNGVAVGLVNARRDDPRVKNSRFIELRGALAADQPHNFYEVMLCADDGAILEGAGSNFYAVLNGELWTAEEGMLPGITRAIVLEVADGIVPITLAPVNRTDVPQISEAMLSSSTRGIVPIVQIGDQQVGNGTPGAIYQMLRSRFEALVARELELL